MKYIKNKIGLFSVFLMTITAISCSFIEMDDYLKYAADGEISYTGKIDSLQILSGKNRVKVQGLITSDPKVTEVRIFWNIQKDSISIPVERTSGVDQIETVIDGLDETIYNFEVYTLDALENKSVVVAKTAEVFGDRYQSSLFNRAKVSETLIGNNLEIKFADVDLTSGISGVEISYTNSEDVLTSQFFDISISSIVINDFKSGSTYKYRSVFVPSEDAIDKFYSDENSSTPIPVITQAPYLVNSVAPFDYIDSGNRWGTPANWTVNAAVLTRDGYGGYDGQYGQVIALESGWGSPILVNAKIYQTVILEPGTYIFDTTMAGGNYDGNGDKAYLTAAIGSSLPDVNDVESSSNTLAYNRLTFNPWNPSSSIVFTVTEVSQVSVGIETTNSDGYDRYLRFNSFSLKKVAEAPYLKNASTPYQYDELNGRWGILSDWITTDPIKNMNGYGGYDNDYGQIFAFETWGAPDIVNGKIYQTLTLGAGSYTLKLTTGAGNTSIPYVVVAKGEALPDFDLVPTSGMTLDYANIDVDWGGVKELNFTLSEYTTISLGIVTTQSGDLYKRLESWELIKN